jgi:hypothetical protein
MLALLMIGQGDDNTQNKSFYECEMESFISTISRIFDYTQIDV